MGRLTEALRRAAGAGPNNTPEAENDILTPSAGTTNEATDDLFPIEIAPPPMALPPVTDASGAALEPASAAIIASPVGATTPVVMGTYATSTVEPAISEAAASVPRSRNGSGHRTDAEPAAEDPTSPGLFERLDATLAQKVVIDQKIMPVSREQYRRLAATLHHAQEDTGIKVVLVASAIVGEGKTLTAANLALTFSESYKRSVLLIDGDFRRPALHIVFNIDAPSGLSEGLTAVVEQKVPLYRVSQRLTILPAGKPSSDPMAGLTSGRMRRVIQEAREAFDWVIIDTPPVGLLPDANLLAAMVDGAVLIVRANSTPYHQVVRAIDALDRDRLLGVVLNSATPTHGSHHNYYSDYHGARKSPDR
jgi:capsular exopolysaccharide synthesis family protein